MSDNKENTAASKAAEWNQRLNEVRAFAEYLNRWPSTTSKDKTEKSLAQWWSRYKYYCKKKQTTGSAAGMTSARVEAINKLITDFPDFERDGIWNQRFDQVKKRLEEVGKLWSYKTEDKEEERVLRWWNQQKTFYRKFRKGKTNVGGMTETRAVKVEGLLGKLGQKTISATPKAKAVDTTTIDASASQVTNSSHIGDSK